MNNTKCNYLLQVPAYNNPGLGYFLVSISRFWASPDKKINPLIRYGGGGGPVLTSCRLRKL